MNDRICNVEKCNRPRSALGMCNLHYQRHIAGRPLIQPTKVKHETCTTEGCKKPPRSTYATLCAMHYHRLYRNGRLTRLTPQPKWEALEGLTFGTLTVVERIDQRWLCVCECGAERLASTGELNRTGDANTCGQPSCKQPPTPRRDEAGYRAAHSRVARDRGSARAHQCIDCGGAADQWSYDHSDEGELVSVEDASRGMPYSLDPTHYEPRCIRCHRAFDKAHVTIAP